MAMRSVYIHSEIELTSLQCLVLVTLRFLLREFEFPAHLCTLSGCRFLVGETEDAGIKGGRSQQPVEVFL
jgi:hypothetical protein